MNSSLDIDPTNFTGLVVTGEASSYELLAPLVEGGQGWVFVAKETGWKARCVVKILRPDTMDATTVERFRREALALRTLTSGAELPTVVRYLDHGVTVFAESSKFASLRLPFLVMEYVNGSTLERMIADRKRGLPLEAAVAMLRDLGEALIAIHAQGIVHRDLKPSNVLVETNGSSVRCKLTDFGIVRIQSSTLSKTINLAGATLGYAPPEQFEARNERVTGETDVFSLAALAFEMLTGTRAFVASPRDNAIAVVRRMIEREHATLLSLRATLDPRLAVRDESITLLDKVLARALDPEPTERPNAAEFLRAMLPPLEGALQSLPASKAPPGSGNVNPTENGPLRLARFFQRDHLWALSDESVLRFSNGRWERWSDRTFTNIVDIGFGGDGNILLLFQNGSVVSWSAEGRNEIERPRTGFIAGRFFYDARTKHCSVVGRMDPALIPHGAAATSPAGACILHLSRPDETMLTFPETGGIHDLAPDLYGRTHLVGENGFYARIHGTRVQERTTLCKGHLFAVRANSTGGLHIVGSGGHALFVSADGDASLESVQTTQSIRQIAMGPDGRVWATADRGRILFRDGIVWKRAKSDLKDHENAIALYAGNDESLALTHEGRFTKAYREG